MSDFNEGRFIDALRDLAPEYFWTSDVEIAIGSGELLTLFARLLDRGSLRLAHRGGDGYLNSTELTPRESLVVGYIDAARAISRSAQSGDGGAGDRETSGTAQAADGGLIPQPVTEPADGVVTPPSPSFELFFVTEISRGNEHFDNVITVTATRGGAFEPTGTVTFETTDRGWRIGDEVAVRTERVIR